MSTSTHIEFRNANDPKCLKAISTLEGTQQWEDNEGPIEDRPGARMGDHSMPECVIETNDEYCGWIIPVADIPKDATHIVIHRG